MTYYYYCYCSHCKNWLTDIKFARVDWKLYALWLYWQINMTAIALHKHEWWPTQYEHNDMLLLLLALLYYKNYGSLFNMSLLTYYCCYCSQPHELYDMIIISHSFMDCDHDDILLLLLYYYYYYYYYYCYCYCCCSYYKNWMKTCTIWTWHITTAATALTIELDNILLVKIP